MKTTLKRMRQGLIGLVAVLGLAALVGDPAGAQSTSYLDRLYTMNTVSATVTADDTDVAILFKYIGPNVSGLVTGTNSTTITLTSGAAGGEVADTSIECPISLPNGGVIDTSNAACNTVQKIVDIVNSTAGSNWRAVPLDSLLTDSTNAFIATTAARQAKSLDGAAINWKTNLQFKSTRLLAPSVPATIGGANPQSPAGSSSYRSISKYLDANNALVPNAFLGTRTVFLAADELSTYGSGTSSFQVFETLPANNNRRNLHFETTNKFIDRPGGATTVVKSFDYALNGIPGDKDNRIVLRINNSAAASVVGISSVGLFFRYPKL